MVTATLPNPIRPALTRFVRDCRVQRLRSMRRWAEEEVVIPDGDFKGLKINCQRQPYLGLFLDAIDSGLWPRISANGPTQTGKTLGCFVVPVVYHLCEVGENVVLGVPDMRIARDKWFEDIEPVIAKTRYKNLIPKTGAGSRGGQFTELRFLNGATLKFMTPSGDDKSRSAFTSRVLAVTEADGKKMDEAASTSRESDPIAQMEGRLKSKTLTRRRVYLESTVSFTTGRIWVEYTNGTESRIVLPCPHCGGWVSPEREHLHGWQEATSEVQARAESSFFCPACGEAWTEDDRRTANLAGKLIHRGQEITPTGEIIGRPPETFTLGFRWSAANNLFNTAGDFGYEEFKARRAKNSDNAEREVSQFIWSVPYDPQIDDVAPLEVDDVKKRFGATPQGIVPAETDCMSASLDVHKRFGAWGVIAWQKDGTGHLLDYGTLEIPSDDVGEEKAILLSLREFRDRVEAGWTVEGSGEKRVPEQVWIDAGYQAPTVYRFCRETAGMRFRPAVGRGQNQQQRQWYNRPKKTGAIVKYIGEEYHIAYLRKQQLFLVETNADYWKGWLHQRLRTELGWPGALSFYQSLDANQHNTLAKQLTAEREVVEFVEGRGDRRKWIRESRSNHYLDTLYMACAAAHLAGVRLATEPVAPAAPAPPPRKTTLRMPDGRPYLVTERK